MSHKWVAITYSPKCYIEGGDSPRYYNSREEAIAASQKHLTEEGYGISQVAICSIDSIMVQKKTVVVERQS